MLGRSALLGATNSTTPGFGTRYANPATSAPSGGITCVKFSPNSDALAMAHGASPYISAYQWNSDTGFGTKYANPTYIPSGNSAFGYSVDFHPAGNAIAYTYRRTPALIIFSWSYSSGFGSLIASNNVSSEGYGVRFSPSGSSIAYTYYVATAGVSPVAAFPWSQTTYLGTQYEAPSSKIPNVSTGNSTKGLAFSPAEDAIAIVCTLSPRVHAYPWSNSTGFGSKYANPSTTAPTAIDSVAFSPSGDAVIIYGSSSVAAYSWSSSTGFGTQYTTPATFTTGQSFYDGISFHPNGAAVAFSSGEVWNWSSASGFGEKYSNPSVAIGAQAYSAAFSPDGKAIAYSIYSTSPCVVAYQWFT